MAAKIRSNADGSVSILNGTVEAIHVEAGGEVTLPNTPGQVLECLTGPCDGGTVEGVSGSYTWPTVSAVQNITGTGYVDLEGSEISYVPPEGASKVVYEFNFAMSEYDTTPLGQFRFYVDGVSIAYARQSWRGAGYDQDRMHFRYVIPIGGVTSSDTGRQSSWTTAKVLKLMARAYSTSYQLRAHDTRYLDGATTRTFLMPMLTITAIV